MTANPLLAYGQWLADAPADWPADAIDSAHRQFVDLVGVMVRGAAEEAPRRIFETVAEWGTGGATVAGMNARLAPPWAALVNGASAHVLDFDDNFDPAKAHATAVLVPAILALAEQEERSGAAAIDAYIAGLQIMGRVGQGVNPVHRYKGWHATATVGAIGAAAASARLLRLDVRQAAHALSIATSMAGGFMAQFGTMTKALHAGLAAKAGVLAASLARRGLDASLEALDGPRGMTRLMVGEDYEAARETLRREGGSGLRFETEAVGTPLLILSEGLLVKRFPNCASAHRAMDGLLALIAAHGFGADDVAAITVRGPARQFDNLMYLDPATPAQARFSLEFALAIILVTGGCRLADFSEETIARGDIRSLYPKIVRIPVVSADTRIPVEISVRLNDGHILETKVASPVGSLAAPLGWDDVWAKFKGCAGEVFPAAQVAALRDALTRLPELKRIAALTAQLVPSAG